MPNSENILPLYMLHFACTAANEENAAERCVADSCAQASGLAQAEQMSRQLIQHHHYTPGALIAFSELDERRIASLSEMETTLYLKTQASRERCAVLFTEWKER